MFSGAANINDSQCNRIPAEYEYTFGGQTIGNNLELDGLDSTAFRAISDIWLVDKFEDAGQDSQALSDWIVTKRSVGPMTMDNICHTDKWYSWADGNFETTDGKYVDVLYKSTFSPFDHEQKLILQGLFESGVTLWHPYVFAYFGEFGNLAAARPFAAEIQDEDVSTYVAEIKNAFQSMTESSCTRFSSIEFFFNGVAPLSLDELQITGALKTLGELSSDHQMSTILMAAWYVRKAEELKDIDAVKSATYLTNAKELIGYLTCELPPDGEEFPGDYLSKITDPERKEMVWWIMEKIKELTGPRLTPEDCLKMYPAETSTPEHIAGTHVLNEEINECVPCTPEMLTQDGINCAGLFSAAQCMDMEVKGTHVLDYPFLTDSYGMKWGFECVTCQDPTPLTKDGLECVGQGRKKKKKEKVIEKEKPVKKQNCPPVPTATQWQSWSEAQKSAYKNERNECQGN